MARSTRSYKKSSVTRFKWTKELIIFLSVLCLAIVLTIVCLIPTTKERFYSEFTNAAASASATPIPEDHVFSYISYGDFIDKKKSATQDKPFIVLYGSSKDTTTLTNLNMLNTKAEEFGVEHIYILNCEFAMNADKEDEEDKSFIEKRTLEIAGTTDIDKTNLDLYTYNQLWVFNGEKSEATEQYDASDIVFNSKIVMKNTGSDSQLTFEFAVLKCFSLYSPKALENTNTAK